MERPYIHDEVVAWMKEPGLKPLFLRFLVVRQPVSLLSAHYEWYHLTITAGSMGSESPSQGAGT